MGDHDKEKNAFCPANSDLIPPSSTSQVLIVWSHEEVMISLESVHSIPDTHSR